MFIDYASATIAMTKKEMKAAGKYGSDEYTKLLNARHENPGFKIVSIESRTKTVRAARKETYRGLTYSYMEAYIAGHDDAEKHIMMEYSKRRCLNEDPAQNLPAPLSYSKMKKWFLEQYPEIAAFCENKTNADIA